jgi:murein DD-endopeptidase MepM/ murein hydrolase activator NlpD
MNLNIRPSGLEFGHLYALLSKSICPKLIGTTAVLLGLFAPVPMLKAALQTEPDYSPMDIGKEAYSLLSSAIADYTTVHPFKSNFSTSPKVSTKQNNAPQPEIIVANQPIPEVFTDSIFVKEEIKDSLTAKLEFEPETPDLSKVSEVVKPVLVENPETNQSFALNVLTSLKPLKLLAMEVSSLKPLIRDRQVSEPQIFEEQNLTKVSSQLIENLESSLEAIAGNKLSSNLAPELPTLIAKVYLPETSDYGLSSNFVWPAQGLLTSQFGWRWGRIHQGIDIAAPVGTPIWATANGIVDFAGWNSGGYGNMVDILHPNGTISRYAHLNAIYVRRGQPVNQSQVIAAMGNTGNSTGPHLHFEIRPNGRAAINPITFLARIVSRG